MDASPRRRRLLIILGIFLAITAGLMAWAIGQGNRATSEVRTQPVVVAAQDVAARTELVAEFLAIREVPEDAVLAQAYTSIEQAVGLTTGVPIYADQQITPNLFVDTQDDPIGIFDPDEVIGPDSPFWRAFSITVPRERAVGGILQDGDRVDLIVSVDLNVAGVLVPTEDEEGNIVLVPQESPVPFFNPEGELEGLRSGMSTKVTIPDLLILKSDIDFDTYIVRVDIAQAEQLTQVMRDPAVGSAANDPFTLALRSRADTRELDLEALGQTLDRFVEFYRFAVPLLFDIEELLGYPFNPIIVPPSPDTPGQSPAPEPQVTPAPVEPTPTPAP
ncbi:hypothetical protein BH23CHL7_BH23CHL7_06290 [soil metagenome]